LLGGKDPAGRFLSVTFPKVVLSADERGGSLCHLCGTPAERFDIAPELLPPPALGLGEIGQRLGAAHAREVGVLLPPRHGLPHGAGRRIRFHFQALAPGRQVCPEPVERLPAQANPLLAVEVRGVLALAAAGPRRGAGGVVAVAGTQVVRPPGLGREGLAKKAGGGSVELLVRPPPAGPPPRPAAARPPTTAPGRRPAPARPLSAPPPVAVFPLSS
jgi:hypothetical protein